MATEYSHYFLASGIVNDTYRYRLLPNTASHGKNRVLYQCSQFATQQSSIVGSHAIS